MSTCVKGFREIHPVHCLKTGFLVPAFSIRGEGPDWVFVKGVSEKEEKDTRESCFSRDT